jgi:mannose-6-phosphate isomerase
MSTPALFSDPARGILPMPAEPLYPLTFDPIFKRLIWGGRRLGTILHKPIGPGDRYAESWEIADHRDDVSKVRAGALAGTSLRDLVRKRGDELLGQVAPEARSGQFPLLLKFLDAADVLSVQVHPDDERGRRLANDNGKTETWVVVHADPGSLIYAGLERGVTRGDFAAALGTPEIERLLHRFEPKPGDCIMIPAGTVHAIGAGIVLAEIQQMSDATFRVHDWGRLGPDGKPRPLHLAEALESTDFDTGPVNPLVTSPEPIAGGTRERLSRCPYFAVERLELTGPAPVGRDDRFTIVVGLGGAARLFGADTETAIELGTSVLLPASIGPCQVVPGGKGVTILTCVVP